ncbi:amidinotransferase [Streptomyces lydicamycinicus]|uniref:Amidinotransferase n=1 Tax=Streptomyces lydicamycinicus TaxID=1546107 RepID=A0A0N7YMT0_9ACTN|nr:amidinotransferase [Streptomyces lydicamycinicus]
MAFLIDRGSPRGGQADSLFAPYDTPAPSARPARRDGPGAHLPHTPRLTELMLKSGTRSAGIAARVK